MAIKAYFTSTSTARTRMRYRYVPVASSYPRQVTRVTQGSSSCFNRAAVLPGSTCVTLRTEYT